MCYYNLLSEYDTHIYWSLKYKNLINFFLKKKTEFFNYPQGLIFFFLIFKSFKYDYIFLTTGPQEFNRIKGLLGIFGYFIFSRLFRILVGKEFNTGNFMIIRNSWVKRAINLPTATLHISMAIQRYCPQAKKIVLDLLN